NTTRRKSAFTQIVLIFTPSIRHNAQTGQKFHPTVTGVGHVNAVFTSRKSSGSSFAFDPGVMAQWLARFPTDRCLPNRRGALRRRAQRSKAERGRDLFQPGPRNFESFPPDPNAISPDS